MTRDCPKCKAKQAEIERLEKSIEGANLQGLSNVRLYLKSQARVKELEAALGFISNIGGNIPDEILEEATGPNDAAYRGGMLVSCRQIAQQALSHSDKVGEIKS